MNKQQYISLAIRWQMLVEDLHKEYAKAPVQWTRQDLHNLSHMLVWHVAWYDGASAMAECGSEEENLAVSLGLLAVNALNECRKLIAHETS